MGGTSTDVTHYAGAFERAFDTASYLGCTDVFIDRALASWRDMRQAGGR